MTFLLSVPLWITIGIPSGLIGAFILTLMGDRVADRARARLDAQERR